MHATSSPHDNVCCLNSCCVWLISVGSAMFERTQVTRDAVNHTGDRSSHELGQRLTRECLFTPVATYDRHRCDPTLQVGHDAWRTTKQTSATVANAPRSFVKMFSRFGGSGSSDSLHNDAEANQSFLGGIPEGR